MPVGWGGHDVQEPDSLSESLQFSYDNSQLDCSEFFCWHKKLVFELPLPTVSFPSFTPSFILTMLLPSSPGHMGM